MDLSAQIVDGLIAEEIKGTRKDLITKIVKDFFDSPEGLKVINDTVAMHIEYFVQEDKKLQEFIFKITTEHLLNLFANNLTPNNEGE